jgi:AmmeMemoRadiSam system protein A
VTARAPDVAPARELTAEDRQALLAAARESIAAHFERRRPRLPSAAGVLGECRGAFVTLHGRDGDLRGCIGMMQPARPLLETVAHMAVAAATEDGRFEPVTESELPRLVIEISVLGPLQPIRPDDVEVGTHGLLISYCGRRGVLLPQVPVEHGWDRERFLEHTCYKAGLSPDTWRNAGVELRGFTAVVFSE